MDIISDIAKLRDRLEHESNIVFVPTMGNLHEGHLALVKLAQQHGSCVVVSVFVNRTQFGPNEDFDRYPRTLESDCKKLKSLGVDVVFTPSESELYPEPQTVFVDLPAIANQLCGAFRPGHFCAVATVVLKLFNVVKPQIAVFGKKDYQQLFIVRETIRQFNLPTKIVEAETERASDGLALSSRNQYLDAIQRRAAPRLYRCLSEIKDAVVSGDCDFQALRNRARNILETDGWKVDYVELRNVIDLKPANRHHKMLVVFIAAWLGQTRLIDNLEICIE